VYLILLLNPSVLKYGEEMIVFWSCFWLVMLYVVKIEEAIPAASAQATPSSEPPVPVASTPVVPTPAQQTLSQSFGATPVAAKPTQHSVINMGGGDDPTLFARSEKEAYASKFSVNR
jgi:hypothetical protein